MDLAFTGFPSVSSKEPFSIAICVFDLSVARSGNCNFNPLTSSSTRLNVIIVLSDSKTTLLPSVRLYAVSESTSARILIPVKSMPAPIGSENSSSINSWFISSVKNTCKIGEVISLM